MTDAQQSDTSERGDQPGQDSHVVASFIGADAATSCLASAFKVEEEVPVGKMPLRVDILLVRREGGQLSEAKRQELSALVPLLNRFTLIEFKGPTDVMERGDFAQLVGCSFLWHSQENELVPHEEVSLVVLSPTVSGALRRRTPGAWASRPASTNRGSFGWPACRLRPGWWKPTSWPSAASPSFRW